MSRKSIAILDYGIVNIKSIYNALALLDVKINLTRHPKEIKESDSLILPGVGAFAKGMENLHKYELVSVINDFKATGKPLMGICLGMQMLFSKSFEFGETEGLDLVSGEVKMLSEDIKEFEKIPHVNWNRLHISDEHKNNPLLSDISEEEFFYFVHSYNAFPLNRKEIMSNSLFGRGDFVSSVNKENVYGLQFHPEKSASSGLKILRNFVKLD